MLRLTMATLLLCGLGLGGQETPEPTALERWQNKSAADKELMLERFEKLRSLSAEDRAQLGERLHDLKRERARLADELPRVDREQLHALPPLERQELLREHQIQELRRHGEELRVGLRPAQEGWIETLIGPEHPRPFHEFRKDLRHRVQGRVLEHWQADGALTPEERALLEAAPERGSGLLRIHRERIEAVIERDGLPPGVKDQDWAKACNEERPERFLKRARKLGLDQLAPPPHGAGPPKPSSGPGLKGLRDLRDALRPTMEDRLEATHAPREERWRLIEGRIATRIRERLADPTWMPELQREPLTGLENPALVDALRRHAGLENERSGFDRPRREGGPDFHDGRHDPGLRRGPGPR